MAQTTGQAADGPRDIPAPGWRAIARRTKDDVAGDHVAILSAGVAFFGLLALFPAIASLVAIAGYVLDPGTVQSQLSALAGVLPENAAEIVRSQARKVAEGGGAGAGLGAVFGILLSLYSASRGIKTLIEGMNIAYDEEESRGFLALNLTALALTLLLIVGVLVALAAIVAAPALLGALGLPEAARLGLVYGRWLLLAVLAMLGLALLYRYGPSRRTPRWRWVSVGSVLATLLWMAGSAAFSVYVGTFGTYAETYGALAGAIVLLTWLWLSAFVVLLGAEVNSEIEAQGAPRAGAGPPGR